MFLSGQRRIGTDHAQRRIDVGMNARVAAVLPVNA